MNILIIGNGFDLAHHLPTQYSDFLDYVKAFKNPDDSEYSKHIADVKAHNSKLYAEMNSLIEDNVLLDYFLSIYEERCSEGKRGWIDFESEISFIIQRLDAAKQEIIQKVSKTGSLAPLSVGIAKDLFPFIAMKGEKSLEEVLRGRLYEPRYFDYQGKRILSSLDKLTRLLEIYLHEYVGNIVCKYRVLDLDTLKIDKVLSFNYTDTYKNYYDLEGKAQYCFIHGRAKQGDIKSCNLVLGIDEYLPDDRRDTDNQFVWFKKFYQRIYKETGSEYLDGIEKIEQLNKMLAKSNPPQTNLYFYGHSLDVTDKDVLRRLIMTENTITHIFYHNRDSMANLISNLVKVIGEDNLIEKTGGKTRTIKFIQSRAAEG